MAKKGIPPALLPAVYEQHGKGRTSREISAWLRKVHQVEVSYATVTRRLVEYRKELAETTQTVARQKLAPHVTNDLDRLEAARLRARGIERRTADPKLKLRAIKTQVDILVKKLHFAGADGATPEQAQTLADLLRQAGAVGGGES